MFIEPTGPLGNVVILDLFEVYDVLPFIFLIIIPLYYYSHYRMENGYAIIQGMFLYVMLLGWVPLVFDELYYYDTFFAAVFLTLIFDYIVLYEEEEVDDLYGEAY